MLEPNRRSGINRQLSTASIQACKHLKKRLPILGPKPIPGGPNLLNTVIGFSGLSGPLTAQIVDSASGVSIETGHAGYLCLHHGLDQCQSAMFLDISEISGVEGV
jgi:hypothetical protein